VGLEFATETVVEVVRLATSSSTAEAVPVSEDARLGDIFIGLW
jgi:hypothetical protein